MPDSFHITGSFTKTKTIFTLTKCICERAQKNYRRFTTVVYFRGFRGFRGVTSGISLSLIQ